MRNFHKLNIDTRGQGSGRVKTYCPFCHATRNNKRDRSLSVDIDKGLYLCHYCGAKGYVPDEAEERARELVARRGVRIVVIDRDDTQRRTTVFVDKVRFKHLGTRGDCTMHYDPISGRYLPLTYEPDGLGGLKPHIHWNHFNIRWVNEQGESQMVEEEERLEEARENKGQYRIREE